MGTTNELPAGPDLRQGVSAQQLRERGKLLGSVNGEPVLLVWRDGEIYAVGATCTHYSGPLAEGLIEGNHVHCPWHHACFDLRTGAAEAPALNPIPCYQVVRDGDSVRVGDKVTQPAPKPVEGPASVVIVGAGAAGHAAAEALRNAGYTKPITLVSGEVSGPVDRPNLSKDYLAGNAPPEWMPLRPPEFFTEQKLSLHTDRMVTAIHPKLHQIELSNGDRIGYGVLLLATGASPIRLPIPGANLPHVFTLRSLADADRIIDTAQHAKRAVVIGASFIGLEVAASLRTRGLEVAVVGPELVPLERVMGAAVGKAVQKLHESHGVAFCLGRKPAAIEQGKVTLDDGTLLEAGLVVMGVGVRPNTALAEKAGLKVENGILVDAQLRTSHEGIWAAGDAARWPSPLTGDSVRIEHWQVAQRQGEAAAKSILGSTEAYHDVPFFWSAHYDRTIRYTGVGVGFTDVALDGDPASDSWTALYKRDGKVIAVATLGRDHVCLEAEQALARGDQGFLNSLARK